MKFYAVYRPYGLETINRDGIQANVLHAFATKAERDDYLRESDPGKVRHELAGSALVKRLRRRPAEEWRKAEFVLGAESITFIDE